MIKVSSNKFDKLTRYLEKKSRFSFSALDKYGVRGVEALRVATPKDTGKTSQSWQYSITKESGRIRISFFNTNIQNGVPIAILLQYGHATNNGGWVEGIDYINPAIRPIFMQIKDDAWREVSAT